MTAIRSLRPSVASVFLPVVFLPLVSASAGQADENRRWFLDVSYTTLRPYSQRKPGVPATYRTFWYSVLEIENRTGKARKLDLTARALTPQVKRQPEVLPGLYPVVTKEIAKALRRPHLANIFALEGEIAAGEKREVLVVFGDLSPHANKIDLRVHGLTNSIYKTGRILWSERTELSLRFQRLGDEFETTRQKVADLGKSWVTIERRRIR